MIRYGSDSFCGTGLRRPAARIRPRLASPTTRLLSMRSPRPPRIRLRATSRRRQPQSIRQTETRRPIWRVNWAVTVPDRQFALPPNINATFEASKQEITTNNRSPLLLSPGTANPRRADVRGPRYRAYTQAAVTSPKAARCQRSVATNTHRRRRLGPEPRGEAHEGTISGWC